MARIRLLELRNTYKWGGGPDKTILLSAERHDPSRVEVVVAYIRDTTDSEFRIAAKAKAKKLQPEEYTGATFSISNLGMMGIKEFTAIINPPEAAIIAVGAANPTPVVRDGQIVIRSIMNVTMSCDHRAIDGATGAKFLQTFKQMLEQPAMMLV